MLPPAAGQGRAFGEADQALAGAGDGRRLLGGRRVGDREGEAVAGRAGEAERDLGAGGVFAGVGEGFLGDAVGGAADGGGDGGRVGDAVVQLDLHARLAALGDQGVQRGQCRAPLAGRLLGLAGPQHADDLPQILQRLVCALPDHPGGPGDLLARCVRPELQGARVHAEQGEPVGEDVVHLAGDGFTGQALGLLGAQPCLGLRPVGPVPEAQHQHPLGADEHAPADDGDGEQGREGDGGRVGDVGVRAQPVIEGEQGELGAADPGDVPERPVHGDREQGDHGGPARTVGHQADEDHRDGEADRPAAAQPDRGAAQGAQDQVGGQQAVGHARVVHHGAGGHREQEADQQKAAHVDDPVPSRPARPPALGQGVRGEFVGQGGREQPPAAVELPRGRRRLVTLHGRSIYARSVRAAAPHARSPTKVAPAMDLRCCRPGGGAFLWRTASAPRAMRGGTPRGESRSMKKVLELFGLVALVQGLLGLVHEFTHWHVGGLVQRIGLLDGYEVYTSVALVVLGAAGLFAAENRDSGVARPGRPARRTPRPGNVRFSSRSRSGRTWRSGRRCSSPPRTPRR